MTIPRPATIFLLALGLFACGLVSESTAGIILNNRDSWAKADAHVCNSVPFVREVAADTLPFTSTLSLSNSCADGVASGSIQYADSLTFSEFGTLTGVYAQGVADCSAMQTNDQAPFEIADGGGQGFIGLNIQVVGRPVQFVFDGTVDLSAFGPASGAEAEFVIAGTTEFRSRAFIRGDSATGPIVWHQEGELQPGFYGIQMTVRATASPGFRTANVSNTARTTYTGALILTEKSLPTIVNSTGDAKDINPGDGVCDTGGPAVGGFPECTLRAAIMEANATPGMTRITFDIPTSDPNYDTARHTFRIRPQPPSALPEITQPVVIDAGGQFAVTSRGAEGKPGATGTTHAGAPDAAQTPGAVTSRPTVILDGTNLGTASDAYHGLNISAGESTVRGLSIVKFNGHGIFLHATGNDTVQGCYLGIEPGITSFVVAGNNRDGILMDNVAGNLLGGSNVADRNVVSNNGLIGTAAVNVHVLGAAAMGNRIAGNYIGTGDKGLVGVANSTGVLLENAPGNTVENNVVSGNRMGVRIFGGTARDNRIEGNLVGLGADGRLAVPNLRAGVEIDGAPFNTVGGAASVAGQAPGNVISANRADKRTVHGVRIVSAGAVHNRIVGNLIGTDQTGALPRGNGGAGVSIEFADSNEVGGDNPLDGNVIADNDSGGVFVRSNGNRIVSNNVGTAAAGLTTPGTQFFGIRIDNATDNFMKNLAVNGNDEGGIVIRGSGARRNTISTSTVGSPGLFVSTRGNNGPGIRIDSAHENQLDSLFVSGNRGDGIILSGGSSLNEIRSCFFGSTVNADTVGANQGDGIHIQDSPRNTADDNTLSGNMAAGIHIQGAASVANTVQNNRVGVSEDGLRALGNWEDGVFVDNAPDNTVLTNVISANGRYGVFVLGGATNCTVEGNLIGTNTDQSMSIGNAADGIRSQLAEKTRVRDNTITASGANGICITNPGTVTGDSVQSNQIFGNALDGVLVSAGTQNAILANGIRDNGRLGINLGLDGVTANDRTDADTGANNLQNFPVLRFAYKDTLTFTAALVGYLQSTPSTTCRIDLFLNSACDASGFGEGSAYLESFPVTTGSNGSVGFKYDFPPLVVFGLKPGDMITATATDDQGNTSEFSKCIPVERFDALIVVNSTADGGDINPGDGVCSTGGLTPGGKPECTLRAAIQEINQLAGPQTVVFDIPGPAPHTIGPASPLPDITGPCAVDATTQPGFAGAPAVELDGSAITAGDGLTLSGNAVTLRGLAVYGFAGSGVALGGTGLHVLEMNSIGTDGSGASAPGNAEHGVRIDTGDGNRIGSPAPELANVIAFNTGAGVRINAGRTHTLRANSIHSNGALGINLAGGVENIDGVTANDAADSDTGPNDLLNYPMLDRAFVGSGGLTLEGTLSGSAGATLRVDVFANSACDSSGFGEGETWLGSFERTLAGSTLGFRETLPIGGSFPPGGLVPGDLVAAVAIDAAGNTSEFSPCVRTTATPLVLTLGVLPNPFLGRYLDIFVAASEALDPQSVSLTVGGTGVPMALADAVEHVWQADYRISASSALPVRVCATSALGSTACDSTTVAAVQVAPGRSAELRSADGRFVARVSGSDIAEAGFVVIVPGGTLTYTVSAPTLADGALVTVEFDYTKAGAAAPADPSRFYVFVPGQGALASVVDPAAGVVRATVRRAGSYELRVGATGASRLADPRFLRLEPNYPNPFNPATTIQYELQTRTHVRLSVYDARGRRVARPVNDVVPAGVHRFRWRAVSSSGDDLPSGVYFVRLETPYSEASRKVVLIR